MEGEAAANCRADSNTAATFCSLLWPHRHTEPTVNRPQTNASRTHSPKLLFLFFFFFLPVFCLGFRLLYFRKFHWSPSQKKFFVFQPFFFFLGIDIKMLLTLRKTWQPIMEFLLQFQDCFSVTFQLIVQEGGPVAEPCCCPYLENSKNRDLSL